MRNEYYVLTYYPDVNKMTISVTEHKNDSLSVTFPIFDGDVHDMSHSLRIWNFSIEYKAQELLDSGEAFKLVISIVFDKMEELDA